MQYGISIMHMHCFFSVISLDFKLKYVSVQFGDGKLTCGNRAANTKKKFVFSKAFLPSWIFFVGLLFLKRHISSMSQIERSVIFGLINANCSQVVNFHQFPFCLFFSC